MQLRKTTINLDPDLAAMLEATQKEQGFEYLKDAIDYRLRLGGGVNPLSESSRKLLDGLFIDAPIDKKLDMVVEAFSKWHAKFPYLHVDREITPEDAEFPPCPYAKALYWKGEFLGFHCRSRHPLFNLPRLKVESLSFNYVTVKDCWDCIELAKTQKTGIEPQAKVTIAELEEHKKSIRSLRDQKIYDTLKENGLRETPQQIKQIFKYVHYNGETHEWRGKSKASRVTGISRPVIDKIIKAFPYGLL